MDAVTRIDQRLIDMFRLADKGLLGGECNRSACSIRPANYWNPHTHAHYCVRCARSINDSINESSLQVLRPISKLTQVMPVEKINFFNELGYYRLKVFENGEIAGLFKFAFTVGVVTGLDGDGYRCRWCYQDAPTAMLAIDLWDGNGDPPPVWIKKKGRLVDGRVVDHGPGEGD